jgi:hypothetical protein
MTQRSLLLFLFILSAAPGALAREETGTIQGSVKFPGETPPPAMFANRDDENCPHGIAQEHLIVEQTTLALKNALVVVEMEPLEEPHSGQGTLATQGCRLTPRIQVLMRTTNLKLENQDGAHHHLHAYRGPAVQFEVDLPEKGSVMRRPMVNDGLYKVNCDRHPWERSWIYVTPHPFAAITDAQGHFLINDLPPGTYQLRTWHEGWTALEPGSDHRLEFQPMGQTLEVRVRRGKTTEVIFDRLMPVIE